MTVRKFLQKSFNRLGYDIRRVRMPEPTGETELNGFIRIIRKHSMLSWIRLEALYDQVLFCERHGLDGDFVECGVWKGGAVGLMALSNLKHGRNRRHLHLFDTFEGIPEADASVDGERAVREFVAFGAGVRGRLIANPQIYENMGRGVGTLEDNRLLLEKIIGYDPDLIHYHKGFFQHTVPAVAPHIGPIALLRLDGDLYASTKVCLDFLYDQVVVGGLISIDDYGAYEGCQKAVDEFFQSRGLRIYMHKVDSELRVLVKR